MAYPPPPQMDGRGPHEGRPGWGPAPYHASAYNPRPPTAMIPRDVMDPEDSGSDVSVGGADAYHTGNPAEPAPPGPAKQLLESIDAIHARLGELNHVEDSNNRKLRSLTEKRKRQDERIRQKRDAQDRKIRAINEARERHDVRIGRRRGQEDARFRAIDEQMEEEENRLRGRLKRIKRGLPLDESPHQAGRSMSNSSMSPPGPSFSTVPPPAKRHQTGPPSHNDNIHTPPQGNLPLPPPNTSSAAPSYSFYQQGNQKPYQVPYHPPSSYSTVPPPPPPTQAPPPLNSHPSSNERSPYATNGRPPSPLPRPAPLGSTPQHESSSTISRQTSSSYDTRPPPPSSGFASINAPSHSGFAAVNARSAATPPSAYSSIARPAVDTRTPNAAFPDAQNEPQRYGSNGNGSNSAGSTPAGAAGGKRTPSTTHPYQMSEAFANRHHHCERVDNLNRGIWTYHGPNLGTADHPTGPPIEMYLRCNHDNCRRIDWRTVHGLQCHIVKNHEQPKGTIGSLEKALDRYGVPISEVEEYEKEHGEGTGGTMADPKNLKIKNKLREGVRKSAPGTAPGSWGLEPTARPAGYKPSPGPDSNPGKIAVERDMGDFVARRSAGYVEDVNSFSDNGTSRFEAIRGDWRNTPSRPPAPVDANRQLQGDAVMQDRESPAPKQPEPAAPEQRQWSTTNFRPYMPPPTATPPANFVPSQQPAFINSSAPLPQPQSAPTASTSPPTPYTQDTPASSVEPKADAENVKRPDGLESTPAALPVGAQTQTDDTEMSGIRKELSRPSTADNSKSIHPAQSVEYPKLSAVPVAEPTTESKAASNMEAGASEENKVDAMEIDSKKESEVKRSDAEFKEPPTPVRGTRSALQSPVIAHKPLPPTSAKRNTRRASTATSRRLSGDGSTDGHPTAPSSNADELDGERIGSTRGTDDGEGYDGDSITVSSRKRSKEDKAPGTPPRRANNGRFTKTRRGGS